MAPPDKRAVAPGAQPVRVDNDKESSWVNSTGGGLVAQIFFATNDATLDSDDMAKLDALGKEYAHDMILNPKEEYRFYFFGYADHRGNDAINGPLSQRRAEAVETYLRQHVGTSPMYIPYTKGLGADLNDDKSTENSKKLAIHRKVDILGPKLRGVPPDPPPPSRPKPPQGLYSTHWKARLKRAGSVSWGPYTGDRFFMDIVDLENKLIQEFIYNGMGFGKSPAPGGFSYSHSPSEWDEFITNTQVELADFEGFAFHTALQSQTPVLPGGTADMVILTLAKSKKSPGWIYLFYKSFTIIDPNAGLGAAQTGGTLEPVPEFHGPKDWKPTDP